MPDRYSIVGGKDPGQFTRDYFNAKRAARGMPLIGQGAGGVQGVRDYTGGGGGGGVSDYSVPDIQSEVSRIPMAEINIDVDAEKYASAIKAGAMGTMREAVREGYGEIKATAAETGRAPGEGISALAGEYARGAADIGAQAAKAGEEFSLQAQVESERLKAAERARITNQAIAQAQLKWRATELKETIKAQYNMLSQKLAAEREMLQTRLGFEAGQAEANRRAQRSLEEFRVNAELSALRLKEEQTNLRFAAGLDVQKDQLALESQKLSLLDRSAKLQATQAIYDWTNEYGRAATTFYEGSEDYWRPYGGFTQDQSGTWTNIPSRSAALETYGWD